MRTGVIFLGTGGGRFVTISQQRSTGGIYVIDRDNRIHIDPGPGALIRMHEAGLDPALTDAMLISHCHPDHYSDAEILIEAMTEGCNRKRGILLASRSILKRHGNHGPAVSRYHQSIIGNCVVARPGVKINIGQTSVLTIPAFHSDTSGVGFRIGTASGAIVWGSDTAADGRLPEGYAGAKILILSVTTPEGIRIPFHLNTEDAAEIAGQSKPELCVITHFGVKMIKSDVRKQARIIRETSGVKTIAARDGLHLDL